MSETAWQDIETAPKDGTTILIWSEREGAEPIAAQWDYIWTDGAWIVQHGSMSMRIAWVFNPTHWMPLPNPPTP